MSTLFEKWTSDGTLVRRALAGDRGAFGRLVERHLRGAQALAFAHVRSVHDAEDVAQDAFVLALERLDTLREPQRFGGWLATIVRNRASVYRTRARREAPMEGVDGEAPSVDIARRDLLERVRAELDLLDDVSREVLVLFYLGGHSTGAIASRLEITPAATRKRLQRAREALGTRLMAELAEDLKPDRRRYGAVLAALPAVRGEREAVGGVLGSGVVAKLIVAGVAVVAVSVMIAVVRERAPETTFAQAAGTATENVVDQPELAAASPAPTAAVADEIDAAAPVVTLPATRPVRVRVLNRAGDVVPSADVTMELVANEEGAPRDPFRRRHYGRQTERTDEQGVVVFEGIPVAFGEKLTVEVQARSGSRAARRRFVGPGARRCGGEAGPVRGEPRASRRGAGESRGFRQRRRIFI